MTGIVSLIREHPVLGGILHRWIGAPTTPPATIPALRQWSGATGTYTFAPASRIVVGPSDVAALGATAATLADELTVLRGLPVIVVHGEPAIRGDVLLGLSPVPHAAPTGDTRAEAYRISIGPNVCIEGQSDAAVFNGTRTLLQLLHQSRAISYGTAIDWPTYRERGLLIDLGRKFVPIDWLQARIREMAYLKMNVLHLHLSDDAGFRLQSDSHPEITSPQHYSKQEMIDLICYATRHHVDVVPEIDFPAHAGAILAAHGELRLISDSGVVRPGMIDLSKPGAYSLIHDLLDEFLPLFPGKYWHIGADEYLADYGRYPQFLTYAQAHYGPAATPKDVFYSYVNWSDSIVRAAGKITRVWNDGLRPADGTVTVNSGIVVDHWSAEGRYQNPWLFGSSYTATQLISQGHLIANRAFTPTYYTTGLLGRLLTAPTWAMYDLWDPTVFVDGAHIDDPNANLGSMLSLWFDGPTVTDTSAAAAIHDRLRVMAQRTWGSPKPAKCYYRGFSSLITKIGDAPDGRPRHH